MGLEQRYVNTSRALWGHWHHPLLPHRRSPQGVTLPLFHGESPGKGQWDKECPRAQSPRGHTLQTPAELHLCTPAFLQRYGMGGCVQTHAHVGPKRTGTVEAGLMWLQGGIPALRGYKSGCLDRSWARDTSEGLRKTHGGSWPGILRVELSGLWGAGGLEQGVGRLFGITSTCQGKAQLCLVVLSCLTQWHPAVTRVPLSIGAPRGWGHPRVEATAWERLCRGDHPAPGPGQGLGGGVAGSPFQAGGHRAPAVGVPRLCPGRAGPGRGAPEPPPAGGVPAPPGCMTSSFRPGFLPAAAAAAADRLPARRGAARPARPRHVAGAALRRGQGGPLRRRARGGGAALQLPPAGHQRLLRGQPGQAAPQAGTDRPRQERYRRPPPLPPNPASAPRHPRDPRICPSASPGLSRDPRICPAASPASLTLAPASPALPHGIPETPGSVLLSLVLTPASPALPHGILGTPTSVLQRPRHCLLHP